jgi:ApeA N-terminal domain 1
MTTDHAVTEALSLFGDWFLPTSPERRLAGQLSYDPPRIELLVNGTFRPDVPDVVLVGSDYPIVHGFTHEGEAITLIHSRCIERRSGNASVQVDSERVLAQYLLIGTYANENSTYPAFAFRVPGLQVWLSRKIIQQSVEVENEPSAVTHVYRVLDRKEKSVYVPSIRSTLSWFVGYTSIVNPFLSIAVNTAGRFVVRPDSARHLDWYLGQYRKITTLLSIISGGPLFADCMSAFLDPTPRNTCSLVFSTPGERYWERPRPKDFYVSCSELGIEFSEILRRWFTAYDRIDTVSRLAASVLTSQNLWPHFEFLSLMHVLEGFHRSLYPGLYMPGDAYENIKQSLYAAIPPDISSSHRSALRSRIAYGNEISLRRRLNDLAKNLSLIVRMRIFGNEDGSVPGQWVDTRNFYSHWDPNSKSNLLENNELIHANVRMRHFLRALYLNLLQVPEDAIQCGVFGSSDDGRFLTHINE